MIVAMPKSSRSDDDSPEDLGLHGHVERRGRLVGEQHLRAAGDRDRDHHALAHAAAELVRVVAEALARPRMPTRSSSSTASSALRLRDIPRLSRRTSVSWSPTVNSGFERRHRVLEDHRDPRAPYVLPAALVERRPTRRRRAGSLPPTTSPGYWTRPISARSVTLLPHPDSPTRPSVLPASTSKLTPSAASATFPPWVGNPTESSSTESAGTPIRLSPAQGRGRGCRRRRRRRG